MVKLKDIDFDRKLYVDDFYGVCQDMKFYKWFFSKYPDIENPLMKQYPEDTREEAIGEGIFESITECNFHYCHRLAISKLIKDFCVDVMGATSANIDFEINGEFIAKHYIVVRAFLNTILRGEPDGDISKGDISKGDISKGDISKGDIDLTTILTGKQDGDISKGDINV